VPFFEPGRKDVLELIDRFCDSPECAAAWLVHASGGMGKTRLFIEACKRLSREGWRAGFLASSAEPSHIEALCASEQRVLVVIDYAESRLALAELLRPVARLHHAGGPGHVRVILLARNAGDWWTHLSSSEAERQDLLSQRPPLELPPLAARDEERVEAFRHAAKAFAALRECPPPAQPALSLDDARFEGALYLHMAALAAVDGLSFTAETLMARVLDHEERFWLRRVLAARLGESLGNGLRGDKPVNGDPPAFPGSEQRQNIRSGGPIVTNAIVRLLQSALRRVMILVAHPPRAGGVTRPRSGWRAASAFFAPSLPCRELPLQLPPPVVLGHPVRRPRQQEIAAIVQHDHVTEVDERDQPSPDAGSKRRPDSHTRQGLVCFFDQRAGPADALQALALRCAMRLISAFGDEVPKCGALAVELGMPLEPEPPASKRRACSRFPEIALEDCVCQVDRVGIPVPVERNERREPSIISHGIPPLAVATRTGSLSVIAEALI
jgi:hypothetical protein